MISAGAVRTAAFYCVCFSALPVPFFIFGKAGEDDPAAEEGGEAGGGQLSGAAGLFEPGTKRGWHSGAALPVAEGRDLIETYDPQSTHRHQRQQRLSQLRRRRERDAGGAIRGDPTDAPYGCV